MEISIKKPCHENWDSFTPNEQGAFCGKCVKTVIDFSSKSIEEIKTFFSVKQSEKVCGRFEQFQLNQLSFDAFFREFKGFHLTKRVAVIIYFTFGFGLFNTLSAQEKVETHLKGDVAVEQPIMGKVMAPKQVTDTTKTCVNPKRPLVKGKVKQIKPITEEPIMKQGEVIAEPKKKTKAIKPTPKTKDK